MKCHVEFRFPADYILVKFCSGRCRVSYEAPRDACEYKGVGRIYSKKRRQAVARGDKIDAYEVFIHHDWMCHLCGTEIDKDLKFPDQWAATIDHVTPLSKGGKHEWENVAPAHGYCNFKKSS